MSAGLLLTAYFFSYIKSWSLYLLASVYHSSATRLGTCRGIIKAEHLWCPELIDKTPVKTVQGPCDFMWTEYLEK